MVSWILLAHKQACDGIIGSFYVVIWSVTVRTMAWLCEIVLPLEKRGTKDGGFTEIENLKSSVFGVNFFKVTVNFSKKVETNLHWGRGWDVFAYIFRLTGYNPQGNWLFSCGKLLSIYINETVTHDNKTKIYTGSFYLKMIIPTYFFCVDDECVCQ